MGTEGLTRAVNVICDTCPAGGRDSPARDRTRGHRRVAAGSSPNRRRSGAVQRLDWMSPTVEEVIGSRWAKSPGGMPGWWSPPDGGAATGGPRVNRETMR